jgi:alkylation response protein AidB-like acyl-CoA dehydrogenase
MAERYQPTSDQVALAASAGKSLASLLPLARLHRSHEESAETWAALTELGVFGVAVPEAEGGSGLGATDEALVAIELGRHAVAPSVLATMGAVHLGAAGRRSQRTTAGYTRGERTVFVADSAAELLLVRSASGASLHPRPVRIEELDAQLWSSALFEASSLEPAIAQASAAQVLRLRLIDAAALAGVARAALDMAVAYAGLREQFGRPIGTFQAIKHHCADMALAARTAGDQVSFAAVALDDDQPDAALQIENAFYVAGAAAIGNSGTNIQVHGGIGFSDEADPHLLLKRAQVLVAIGGGLEAALERIARYPVSSDLAEAT